jgi:hypothetical protein
MAATVSSLVSLARRGSLTSLRRFCSRLLCGVRVPRPAGPHEIRRCRLAGRVFARLFLSASAFFAAGQLRAQPEATEGPVVMLPPMMVEAKGTPLKWLYFEAPGFEVLAGCNESIAADVVQRVRQLDELLRLILPERFMAATSVPEILILLDEKVGQTQAREILPGVSSRGSRQLGFLPNVGLADQDTSATFALVNSSTSRGFTYTENVLKASLQRRVPRLPDWLIEGVVGFYRQTLINERAVTATSASWVSRPEFARLAADPYWPRTLLPMEEFFLHGPEAPAESDDLESEWRSQAALFVRWAVLENAGANATAFWKFVDRLEHELPSEALFREHFGIGYSDMRDQLSDYLAPALRQVSVPTAMIPSRQARPKFRAATELEIARIRGDFERMEIDYVRKKSPWLVDKYIEQARATLGRAYYEQEARDPRLLASMGLTELEAGNLANALPWLVDAAAGHVVRPRVYFELARLRFSAALAEVGPTGKLNATQVTSVQEPLFAAHRLQPALLQNYVLLAETMSRSDSPPTAAQLEVLHAGALKFPEVSELVVRAIYFHLVSGQPAAAATLTDAGMRFARDPATRARFERANASFAGPKKPPSE